jgi:hypothetical protein
MKLISRVPLSPIEDMIRVKQEATLQNAIAQISGGADYRIWEPVMRTIGQQWLSSSDHYVIP